MHANNRGVLSGAIVAILTQFDVLLLSNVDTDLLHQ